MCLVILHKVFYTSVKKKGGLVSFFSHGHLYHVSSSMSIQMYRNLNRKLRKLCKKKITCILGGNFKEEFQGETSKRNFRIKIICSQPCATDWCAPYSAHAQVDFPSVGYRENKVIAQVTPSAFYSVYFVSQVK